MQCTFLRYYDILRNAGTYVMVKSLRRNFEVQARIWPCWRVVCNCGVAIRENNDVVTIDMCHGAWRRTSPRVVQKSRQPLGNRMRIRRYGSGQSTRFKVCSVFYVILFRFSRRWTGLGGFTKDSLLVHNFLKNFLEIFLICKIVLQHVNS